MAEDFWTEQGKPRKAARAVARPATARPAVGGKAAPARPRPPALPNRSAKRTGGIGATGMLIAFVAMGTIGHFAGSGLQALVAPQRNEAPQMIGTRPAPTADFVF